MLCAGLSPKAEEGGLLLDTTVPHRMGTSVSLNPHKHIEGHPQILLHGIPPCSPYPDGGPTIELFLQKEITPNVFCRFSSLKTDEIGSPNMK